MMFIKLNGPPLAMWDPTEHVETWITGTWLKSYRKPYRSGDQKSSFYTIIEEHLPAIDPFSDF